MEGAYFSTDLNGEFRYEDEKTKRMDVWIDILMGDINTLEHCTLDETKKKLKRLVESREKYVEGKMKELSERQDKKGRERKLKK